jgi:oligoendopeptidase F
MAKLPHDAQEILDWSWSKFEPYFTQLDAQPLTSRNIQGWLTMWTHLNSLLDEMEARMYIATSLDTEDEEVQNKYDKYLDEVYPAWKSADQKLMEHLLTSGLEPEGYSIPLRNLRAESELFREDNLTLISAEKKLGKKYERIIGAQTVEWEGEEKTIYQLRPVYQNSNREVRERAWRLAAGRQLADREAINETWTQLVELRKKIAANADKNDFRAYQWDFLLRFDYQPDDCKSFQLAIEEVVVPAAMRIYEKRRLRLGVEKLRPWDLDVDPMGRSPLRPFDDHSELEDKAGVISHRVAPQLRKYFDTMRREGLLDIPNRKGKAPGAYCYHLMAAKRPYIFHNAVGLHEDVQTMLHEAGHAFHVFEASHLPYFHQYKVPMEFAEVASMAMELLAAPYIQADEGGYYSSIETARARIEHLEENLLFWPYMAVVDAFQHWVYENPDAAGIPANCDVKWSELWDRFMVGINWSGLEAERMTGWQRKVHIHTDPFYYIEYGIAQLGAVQIWAKAIEDQAGAVANYRHALSLGGTAPLTDLFESAGAKFTFDSETLQDAVNLMEKTISELEAWSITPQ